MAKSCWFHHDSNARNDIKVRRLRREHGDLAYLHFLELIEIMREESSLSLAFSDIELHAEQPGCNCIATALRTEIECMCEVGLFQHDETHFWSERLRRDASEYERKCAQNKANAEKRWQQTQPLNATAKQPQSDGNADAIRKEGKERKERKGKKEGNTLPAVASPSSNGNHKFNPTGKTKFLDWVYLDDAQLERVQSYYEERGLDWEDCKEAIKELDRWFSDNPKMRLKRCDDAKALMGWPLDQALKRKRSLLEADTARIRNETQKAPQPFRR